MSACIARGSLRAGITKVIVIGKQQGWPAPEVARRLLAISRVAAVHGMRDEVQYLSRWG